MGRIGNGREAARIRVERSGVSISRPGIAVLAAVHTRGALRLTEIAHLTALEPPLVSREIRKLIADGHVVRRADSTDGRAAIVTLTPQGAAAYRAYRSATDEIVMETFAGWRSDELHDLAATLERVADDFARKPEGPPGSRAPTRRNDRTSRSALAPAVRR